MKLKIISLFITALISSAGILKSYSQYFEPFEYQETHFAENNLPGWFTMTGDGEVVFYQRFNGSSAFLKVDPLQDKQNIWYAFMHQDIAEYLDIEKLKQPDYQLRMEVRVRTSHAPRRINMYVFELDKGQRTGYLREFDIARSGEWTTLSMTTDNINPDEGNPVMVQVSLMDWGISEIVSLEVDYIKADVVSVTEELPQYGLPIIYRPPLQDSGDFKEQLKVQKSATIDNAYTDNNFHTLVSETDDNTRVISVNNTSIIIMSWDFLAVKDKTLEGSGQLEIYTHSLTRLHDSPKDFGEIRVHEIMDGKINWEQESITHNKFFRGKNLEKVINAQTTIDTKVNPEKGGATRITISKPVMERLISGYTQGLAILPLGYIVVHFYSVEDLTKAPVLYFNLSDK